MYYVFRFDCYYPGGGLNDLRGEFDNLSDAMDFVASESYDYFQIVQDMKVILES